MLNSKKTRVSTRKRVYFQKFLQSLASVVVAVPMFLHVLALCCRSTSQFCGNNEKSNHMLSATSHIELEFLTKFLKMSKFQNQRVPLHHSPGFRHEVPVMRRSWKHLHTIFAINRDFKLVMFQGYSCTVLFR